MTLLRSARWTSRPLALLAAAAAAGLLQALAAAPALAAGQPVLKELHGLGTSPTCATLSVGLELGAGATTAHFEYLPEQLFKEDLGQFGAGTKQTEEFPIPEGSGNSVEVCGLAHHTIYRFRAVGTNSQSPPGGTVGDEEATFTTFYGFGPSHELTATFGTEAGGDPVPLSKPSDVAVDQSNGDIYATDPGLDERQAATATATGGTFTLTFAGSTTEPLPFDASAASVQSALEGLSTIGARSVAVSGGPAWAGSGELTLGSDEVSGVTTEFHETYLLGKEILGAGIPSGTIVITEQEPDANQFPHSLILSKPATETLVGAHLTVAPSPYQITFRGILASTDVEQIQADGSALTGGTISVATTTPGAGGAAVEKFSPSGQFILIFGQGVDQTTGANVCTAASHHVCQPGSPAPATITNVIPGQLNNPAYLAVDNTPGGDGDVYVADRVTHLIQKFDSSGHIVPSWGEKGQQAGPTFPDTSPEFPLFGEPYGVAVGPEGDLYVGAGLFGGHFGYRYLQDGALDHPNGLNRPSIFIPGDSGVKVDGARRIYGASASGVHGQIEVLPGANQKALTVTLSGIPTTGFALDPAPSGDGEELYQNTGTFLDHYSSDCNPELAACQPFDSFGVGQLSGAEGASVDAATHTVYVADTGADRVATFTDIRPATTTDAAAETTETTVTLHGHVDPETNGVDHGPIAECLFEWGTSRAYGNIAPCEQPTPYLGSEAVTAKLEGLTPITALPVGTIYHYRILASNQKGATSQGQDRTARTTAPPRIEGVSSSHLSATSAELDATVIPNGLATTYRFQYGPTPDYGETTQQTDITGSASGLFEAHRIAVPITGLQSGVTYHFRLVAENTLGTITSEDQTFEFFPPGCPNSAARQQTGSAYLPDCRAYELASPTNAGGTLLVPGGPSSAQATAPSRFAFVGNFGSIPGEETINTGGDLYLATRTASGWVTHYIGLPGSEAGCMGGPPNAPTSNTTLENPTELQAGVLADPSLGRILDWQDGEPIPCTVGTNGTYGADQAVDHPSNAPYLWNADGSFDRRLPTNLASVPGALQALDCPYEERNVGGTCASEVTASPDLNHLIFSSNSIAFAPGGLTAAPGSVYDNDLTTGEVRLISTLARNGEPIPQDPVFASTPSIEHAGGPPQPGGADEYLRVPAVSTDGSHVLISTATSGVASLNICAKGNFFGCPQPTDTHLYMSIDDAGAVEVSYDELTEEDVAVHYVGMTADGSKVYFTSERHLTDEDPDHGGTSLYMWSRSGEEEGKPITLISKANPGSPPHAGDTAACDPASVQKIVEGEERTVPWTSRCGVVTFTAYPYAQAFGGAGGNGVSDTAIASKSGDIYFYSPEQLDGTHGVPGLANLYDYRQGHLQFVATLNPKVHCIFTGFGASQKSLEHKACTAGPIVRINVSPDDSHMAFATATQLTSYESSGHVEMYSYTPSTESIVCDSCNPSGRPAIADVEASENGLFMTDDGRTFFSTSESLLPADTDESTDVYEYVAGRPRLITPGTGKAAVSPVEGLASLDEIPGLIGVSANGTDVYFSTFDVLLSEDRNGDFLKFYDARTNGGFAQPPPGQPCAAAEECHGPGTEAPRLPIPGTAATLAGGNATSESGKHQNKKRHKKSKKRHRGHRADANRGGSR